jgi:hypothetical protein
VSRGGGERREEVDTRSVVLGMVILGIGVGIGAGGAEAAFEAALGGG